MGPSTSIRGSPSPTSRRLCHRARGCADRRTTPGPGHIASPTPQAGCAVVPAGGCRGTRAKTVQATPGDELTPHNGYRCNRFNGARRRRDTERNFFSASPYLCGRTFFNQVLQAPCDRKPGTTPVGIPGPEMGHPSTVGIAGCALVLEPAWSCFPEICPLSDGSAPWVPGFLISSHRCVTSRMRLLSLGNPKTGQIFIPRPTNPKTDIFGMRYRYWQKGHRSQVVRHLYFTQNTATTTHCSIPKFP